MKKIFFFLALSISIASIFFSCKKDKSCEGCKENNKPPTAIAGPDQSITLPTDSISLDGSASNDPDGTISGWLWKKISGPASFNIGNTTTAKTIVRNLDTGIYKFELKVTDNKGFSATDTMQMIVDAVVTTNHPPVANAGPDQIITLPVNSVNLDGSASTDPDNNITTYAWTKISGPSSFNITNTSAVQTQVTNVIEGAYQYELKVTDAGGLFSKDTMSITVNSVAPQTCDNTNRPMINAMLIPVGSLSIARHGFATASAGNKIFYAGGHTGNSTTGFQYCSRVDIFDIPLNQWTTAELSEARGYIVTAVLGNKIYFAGGIRNVNGDASSRIDIYDVATNQWTTTELSEGRWMMSAGAAGNKVFFAGGYNYTNGYRTIVEIYDVSSNTWTVAPLSNRTPDASVGISTTVIGNKIFFAGASGDWPHVDFGEYSSTINIYDVSNDTWSVSYLGQSKGSMAGIAVGNKNYWAGGRIPETPSYSYLTNEVEIRDANSATSINKCLFQPNGGLPNFEAVLKNNKIVFFTGAGSLKNKFDIYDITTDTWAIGVMNQSLNWAYPVSVNNTIYVAAAEINGSLSNQVWKLEF